ncbi:hypothetical protein [Cellulomonas sp. T2.31MG-18]|uniref:hypothetical protein n=1 Tax=Cellulomonas sp. T2.31MG-18 TaxID=3157619 RepID=UPI00366D78E6
MLAAVLPSIGVGLIFWFGLRAVMNADRNERRAQAQIDAQQQQQSREENVDGPPTV